MHLGKVAKCHPFGHAATKLDQTKINMWRIDRDVGTDHICRNLRINKSITANDHMIHEPTMMLTGAPPSISHESLPVRVPAVIPLTVT